MKQRTKLLICAAAVIVIFYTLFGTFPRFINTTIEGKYYLSDGSDTLENSYVMLDGIIRKRLIGKDTFSGLFLLCEPDTLWDDPRGIMLSGSTVIATLPTPTSVQIDGFDSRKLSLLHMDSFMISNKQSDYSAIIERSAIWVSPDFNTIFILHNDGAAYFTSEDLSFEETAAYITSLAVYYNYQPHEVDSYISDDFVY